MIYGGIGGVVGFSDCFRGGLEGSVRFILKRYRGGLCLWCEKVFCVEK